MNSKYKLLLKNTGLLTVGNFSSKILSFLFVPLYTSVLTTAEYGVYDLVVTSVSLVVPILTLNIVEAIMRFALRSDIAIEAVATIGLRFVLRSLPIVGFITFVIARFNVFLQLRGYELFVFIYYLTSVLNLYFIQLARGCEKVKDLAIAGVLGTATSIALNLIFLIGFKFGLKGFFLANILSNGIVVLYYAAKLKVFKLIKFKTKNRALRKEMLAYCIPLITVTLGWWINSSISKYAVSIICGVAANGLLAVAYKIPNIMSMVQSIFMQAWNISAIKEYESKDVENFYSATFTFMNMAMVFVCSVLILFTKLIAKLLFANEFYNAWEFAPFLVIASVFNAAGGYLGPILGAQNKTKPMAKSAVYGAVTNIVLSFVLVYFIGVQGAAIATMTSSLVIYLVRHKELGFILKNKSHKSNIISWILIILQAFVAIYTNWYIVQIVIILVMVVVFNKQIRVLLEKGLSVIRNIKKKV